MEGDKERAASRADPLVIPQHVAMIMDGNGRWARLHGLPRLAGHRQGAENLQRILETCRDYGIKILSLYAFSTENWSRPPEEVEGLMILASERSLSATASRAWAIFSCAASLCSFTSAWSREYSEVT